MVRSFRTVIFDQRIFSTRNFHVTSKWLSEPVGSPPNCMKGSASGLLLGIYSKNDGRHDSAWFSKIGEKYNKMMCNKLTSLLRLAGPCPKLGETRIFYGIDNQFAVTGVVGLGDCVGFDDTEDLDVSKENSRIAAGAGCRALKQLGLSKIYLESMAHLEATVEGAELGLWEYQSRKNKRGKKVPPVLEPYGECELKLWEIGMLKAKAQNLARELSAEPANIITPVAFSHRTVDVLSGTGVCVEVRQKDWAERQGMGAFLAVAKGSCQEPIFLELSYCGTGDNSKDPLVLVGLGCTFDSGGLQLRTCPSLENMWGTMSGAAVVVAVIKAVAALKLPLNIRGLIPLAEHMPGCHAMKPGDMVTACNGKNILIQSTQAAGRLLLADALSYAKCYCPKCIIDVATLDEGVFDGLSSSATGAYANNEELWDVLHMSSIHAGDRLWRLPLFKHFTQKITNSSSVDTKNYGRYGWGGGPCRAAAFLREFLPCENQMTQGWVHLDTRGVFATDGYTDPVYLVKGMTGRPTRTVIEFLSQLTKVGQPKE